MVPSQSDSADRPTILLIANDHYLRRAWRSWVGESFPQCRLLEADTPEMLRWVLSRSSPKVVVVDSADLGSRVAAAVRMVQSMAPQAELVTASLSGQGAGESGPNDGAAATTAFRSLVSIIQEILGRSGPTPRGGGKIAA